MCFFFKYVFTDVWHMQYKMRSSSFYVYDKIITVTGIDLVVFMRCFNKDTLKNEGELSKQDEQTSKIYKRYKKNRYRCRKSVQHIL